MRWRGAASILLTLLLTFPATARAQQSAAAPAQNACAALGELSGKYRTEDGDIEAVWSFTTSDGVAGPGDSFLAEHTYLPAIQTIGQGPHYVLYGVIGADCQSVSGKWRALFAPDDNTRLMAGSFSAALAPETITVKSADDDTVRPHGWAGIAYLFHDEPDPPLEVALEDGLAFHGPKQETATVVSADRLEFHGPAAETSTVALSETLELHGKPHEVRSLELAGALQFHGKRHSVRTLELTETLAYRGQMRNARTIEMAGALEFHGNPLVSRAIGLGRTLEFHGKAFAPRTVALSETLALQGKRRAGRTIDLTGTLELHGETKATRIVGLSGTLEFSGQANATRTVALSRALAFPGAAESAAAAIIATPPDPVGAGPCGEMLDADLGVVRIGTNVPASADGITVETIEKLRAAFASYHRPVADTLRAQADCMEARLENFRHLASLSAHGRWVKEPVFDGEAFYSNQIGAARNAALYLRQIDWELAGMEQALKHEEQFFIFDRLDAPQALKFGLVTEGGTEPDLRDSNSMRMRDFELLKKHAPADAEALVAQRNHYFQKKLAERFAYLEELLPRTVDGLAAWTQVENHVTRRFIPRVASAISRRVTELKDIHDRTQPASVEFSVPIGEFDAFSQEFSKLTQVTGEPAGGSSFSNFMDDRVWYGEFDPWPDAGVVAR